MKKDTKLFYLFGCPMGAKDSKAGITGHPEVRLGVYQNSYSRNSHVACFDVVYFGLGRSIGLLEKAVKDRFNVDIERDGRGHSEWISGYTSAMLETAVDEIINSYKFKIQKVSTDFLPLSMDNMQDFLDENNLN